jgi:hypothetical protein
VATTGVEFGVIFDRKIDKSYSNYYNATKKNQLFKEALITAIETKYRQLDQQKEYDEINSVIKTEEVFTPTNNQLFITTAGSPNISDYRHLLAVKCKYTEPLSFTVSGATKASPIVISINESNNLRDKEQIIISGVTGNTSANGTFYIKKRGSKKAELYNDKNFTSPTFGNNNYVSGGSISRVHYQYAKPYISDRKISIYGRPTADHPKFEIATGKLKLFPSDKVCSEITLDYITTTAVFVDVNNSVIDLELTYPYKFLVFVAEIAAKMFGAEVKDKEMFDFANLDTKENS